MRKKLKSYVFQEVNIDGSIHCYKAKSVKVGNCVFAEYTLLSKIRKQINKHLSRLKWFIMHYNYLERLIQS